VYIAGLPPSSSFINYIILQPTQPTAFYYATKTLDKSILAIKEIKGKHTSKNLTLVIIRVGTKN
jgi:hypothetical protein